MLLGSDRDGRSARRRRAQGPAVRLAHGFGAGSPKAEPQVLLTVPDWTQLRVLVCRRRPACSPVVIMARSRWSRRAGRGPARGWVSAQEVTALVVHARAHHRVAVLSGEVAMAVVEMPWRLVVEAFSGSGARSHGCRWAPWRGGCVAWWPGVPGPVDGRGPHLDWGARCRGDRVDLPGAGRRSEPSKRGPPRSGMPRWRQLTWGCSGRGAGPRRSAIVLERRQRLQRHTELGALPGDPTVPADPARHLHLVRS